MQNYTKSSVKIVQNYTKNSVKIVQNYTTNSVEVVWFYEHKLSQKTFDVFLPEGKIRALIFFRKERFV